MNTIGCYGLRASIDFLLEVGIENTSAAVQALGDRVWDGVTALGFETLGRRTTETGAGIVLRGRPGRTSPRAFGRLVGAE